MRISGVHIQSFGQLRDVTLADLDADIVCIAGPNEVGKSTVFDFVGSMLYGIYPVTLENHPYAPRDGGTIAGTLSYRLADGSGGRIARRLRSSPDAEWTKGDGLFAHPQQIRNRTLPVVDHVSRSVFRDVYALSLLDLKRFESGTFQEIEERLLGGLNSAQVRPARVVAEALHADASRVWRSDNRGKPLARALAARKRELTSELRELRRAAELLREVSGQLDSINQELASLVSRRESLRQAIANASAARAAVERRRSVEALRHAADAVSALGDVPEDPVGLLERLAAEIRQLDDRIADVRTELDENARSGLRDWPVAALYEQRVEIRAACRRFESAVSAMDGAGGMRLEMLQRARGFEAAAAKVVVTDDKSSDSVVHAFARIDRAGLIDVADNARVLQDEVLSSASQRRRLAHRNRLLAQAAVLSTMLAFVVQAFRPGMLAALIWTIVVGSLAFVAHGRIARRRLTDADTAVRKRVSQLAATLSTRVADLKLHPHVVEGDLVGVVNEIELLRNEARALSRLQRDHQQVVTRFERASRDVVTFSAQYGVAFGGDDAAQVVGRVASDAAADDAADVAVDVAADVAADVAVAATELLARVAKAEAIVEAEPTRTARRTTLQSELQRLTGRRSNTQEQRDALEARLVELGDGNLAAGVSVLLAGRAAQTELIRIAEAEAASDVAPGVASVAPHDGDLSDVDLARTGLADEQALKEEETAVTSRIDELDLQRDKLRSRQLELAKHRGVDDVEGELDGLDAELSAARLRHDALRFLESIVRRADERFREKHQPDVVARANEMLALTTDGKYRRIVFDEKTLEVHIVRAGERTPRPIDESVSQGTRDQVYLALRLALAEHMDEAHEPVPIFLDEVFVTWDAERRKRFYPVLTALAQRRQIFLLTCHRWFEEEVLVELGAHVVSLDRHTTSDDSLQMRLL